MVKISNKQFLVCAYCGKELTKDMEVEYSEYLCEYYCSPDCAKAQYFDYMRSVPLDMTKVNEYNNIGISKDGKLFIDE